MKFLKQSRKFNSSSKTTKTTSNFLKNNSDSLAETAKETKTLAMTTEAVASLARASIEDSRQVVKSAFSGEQQKTQKIDEESYRIIKNQTTNDIIEKLSLRDDILTSDEADLLHNTVKMATNLTDVHSKRPTGGIELNKIVPDLFDVHTSFSRNKGTIDGFYAELKFSINKLDAESVKAIRVFRADVQQSGSVRGYSSLSAAGIALISSTKSGRKNNENVQMMEKRLIERNIKNDYTSNLPVDQFTWLRQSYTEKSGSVSAENNVNVTTDQNQRKLNYSLASYVDPEKYQGMDIGVANNPNVLKNIILQNPSTKINIFSSNNSKTLLEKDPAAGTRTLNNKIVNTTLAVIEKNNAPGFKEIGFFTLNKLKHVEHGDKLEISFEDTTVMYGRTYMYYVTTVDEKMNDSLRSKIMKVSIEKILPPAQPIVSLDASSDKFVVVLCKSEDEFISKFEIYRKEEFSNEDELEITSVKTGLSKSTSKRANNGFIMIGETQASLSTSSPFRDKRVIPGKTYQYRIYSVDCFGNKSQEPVNLTVFLKDRSSRLNNLKKPTIITELDKGTGYIKVTMTNDDDRLNALFLSRRDLTLKEKAFHIPLSPSLTVLGAGSVLRKNSLTDNKLFDEKASWTGFFSVQEKGKDVVQFVDKLTRFDHTYQYQVFGVDRYGNKTIRAVSAPIFVGRNPRIETPISVSASLIKTSDVAKGFDAIKIEWKDSNLDVEPIERLGNRDTLDAYKVRTLFQVERRKIGEERWTQFSLTEDKFIIDNISNETSPSYRPPFLKQGDTYQYRVAAFQTGSFISDFSLPLTIKTDPGVLPPDSITIRSADTKTKPFYVVVNWTKDKLSGVVDLWDIERAVTNNIFGQRLDVKNKVELEKLQYTKLISVGHESTRARSKDSDDEHANSSINSIFVSDMFYIDKEVSFGNSYFYRIRAVAVDGTKSDWSYKGVVVTDASFETLMIKSLSKSDIEKFSTLAQPITISRINTRVTSGERGKVSKVNISPVLSRDWIKLKIK